MNPVHSQNKLWLLLLGAALIMAVAAPAEALINTGASPNYLSIFFGEYPNLVESGTSLHWTYDITDKISMVNSSSCTAVRYTTGYIIVPYSYYTNHKTTIDNGVRTMESLTGHDGTYINPDIGQKITTVMNRDILGGETSYNAKELSSWQNPTSCNPTMTIPMQGDGLNKYFVIGAGCIYNYEFFHGARSYCEVATATVNIYNCGTCGSDICLLDSLNHDAMSIDGFYNLYGTDICAKRGTLHGVCDQTKDCINIVSKPSTTSWQASHSEPYQALTAVHCEKETPGDPRLSYVNQHLSGGSKGACEYGAEAAYDCSDIFGASTSYEIRTLDGGYNSQRSGWAIKDGKCVIGECNGFSACYDLYNSIYYDCVYTSGQYGTSYGVCQQKTWTTAQIQSKCETAEGRKPDAGKAWYVDSSGKCYQDTPTTSECTKASDCACKSTEIASCQQIVMSYGTVGKCKCVESGGGVTPSVCGDHVCDTANGESYANCPQDCYGPTTTLCIGCGGGGDDGGDDSWMWWVAGGLLLFIIAIVGIGAYFYFKK